MHQRLRRGALRRRDRPDRRGVRRRQRRPHRHLHERRVAAVCGDGIVQEGVEACDDGNDDDLDACSNACALASCGDGVTQQDEECDDGNDVDTDACTNACLNAKCGDGHVQDGVEECDDGNAVDTDACTNACTLATCGDGIVQEGVEECDDGNDVDTDACLSTCKAAKCGDGVVQAGVEECDDGNMVNNDGCTNECKTGCGGALLDPGNGIKGCWYTAQALNQSCTQVCANHGGVDLPALQHSGNAIGKYFWPNKANGSNWVSIECSSTDNNTNWGANNGAPDVNFTHSACYVNCACKN
ncbi:MAG: DUF4215 domain-containing protein [Myxococcales bacterium]|nr:DUF4215 domain-containing protein [Myxococcales bacterium]